MARDAHRPSETWRRTCLRLFFLLGLPYAALRSCPTSSGLPLAARLDDRPTVATAEISKEPTVRWTFQVLHGETGKPMPARVSIRSLRAAGKEEFVLVPFRRPAFYAPEAAEVLEPSIDYGFLGSTAQSFHTPGESTLDVPQAGFENLDSARLRIRGDRGSSPSLAE
jgi:hypothetical protein